MVEESHIEHLKEELQEAMSHSLVILRDVLSSLRHEHNALHAEDSSTLKSIMEDRFALVDAFEKWNQRVVQSMKRLKMGTKINDSHSPSNDAPDMSEAGGNFVDLLAELQKFLTEDDFELLLLKKQLLDMLEEIQKQTHATLDFLEHKTSPFMQLHSHYVSSKGNTLNLTVGVYQKKTAIGLMDAEDENPEK
jgi:hypothetical protein